MLDSEDPAEGGLIRDILRSMPGISPALPMPGGKLTDATLAGIVGGVPARQQFSNRTTVDT